MVVHFKVSADINKFLTVKLLLSLHTSPIFFEEPVNFGDSYRDGPSLFFYNGRIRFLRIGSIIFLGGRIQGLYYNPLSDLDVKYRYNTLLKSLYFTRNARHLK